MTGKISLRLGDVQKTLMLPLLGRAIESKKKDPLLVDKKAIEIINNIDYDFQTLADKISPLSQLGWVVRSYLIDEIIKNYLEHYPTATIVNIGCGFDTTFERIDNGEVIWYDLDLPDVIEQRKNFVNESDRRKFLACSFLDYKWFDEINERENILFISAGVFYYFKENDIKSFIKKIADCYPKSELVFDATSPFGIKMANKMVIKKSGLDEKSFLNWGIKNAKEIQQFDNRIKIVSEKTFFKTCKQRLTIATKIATTFSDIMKIQYLIHIKFI